MDRIFGSVDIIITVALSGYKQPCGGSVFGVFVGLFQVFRKQDVIEIDGGCDFVFDVEKAGECADEHKNYDPKILFWELSTLRVVGADMIAVFQLPEAG